MWALNKFKSFFSPGSSDVVEESTNSSFIEYFYDIDYFDETNGSVYDNGSTPSPPIQKRSVTEAPVNETSRSPQQILKLQKTNSASTLLGLAVILKPASFTPNNEPDNNVNIHDFDGYKVMSVCSECLPGILEVSSRSYSHPLVLSSRSQRIP